jgi:hypothetical protein
MNDIMILHILGITFEKYSFQIFVFGIIFTFRENFDTMSKLRKYVAKNKVCFIFIGVYYSDKLNCIKFHNIIIFSTIILQLIIQMN